MKQNLNSLTSINYHGEVIVKYLDKKGRCKISKIKNDGDLGLSCFLIYALCSNDLMDTYRPYQIMGYGENDIPTFRSPVALSSTPNFYITSSSNNSYAQFTFQIQRNLFNRQTGSDGKVVETTKLVLLNKVPKTGSSPGYDAKQICATISLDADTKLNPNSVSNVIILWKLYFQVKKETN